MRCPRLQILGGFSLIGRGGERLRLPTRKSELLLAYLAMHPDTPIQRARLADLLWGDTAEAQARSSLRSALAWIRAALSGTAGPVLSGDRRQVSLAAGAVEVDAIEFRRLAARGSQEAGAALRFYGGDLLAGLDCPEPLYGEWVVPLREALHDEAVTVARRAAGHALVAGNLTDARAVLRRLLELDPVDEWAYARLIESYTREGAHARAWAQFDACRRVLREELGAAPGVEVRAACPGHGDADNGKDSPGFSRALFARRSRLSVFTFTACDAATRRLELAPGLGDALCEALSRFTDLAVLPMPDPANGADAAASARAAGADYALEGSLRRLSGGLHAAVRLLDAQQARVLWADSFTVESNLADGEPWRGLVRPIVAAAGGRIRHYRRRGAATVPLAEGDERDLIETAAVSMGCLAGEGNTAARERLARLVERHPADPVAAAHMAYAHFYDWMRGWRVRLDEGLDAALQWAQRAVRLGPEDPIARESLAWILMKMRRYDEAEQHYRIAMGLNPYSSATWNAYGMHLMLTGRPAAGAELMADAIAADPDRANTKRWCWGMAQFAQGRDADARAALDSVVGTAPVLEAWRAAARARAGDRVRAREAARSFESLTREAMQLPRRRSPESWHAFIVPREPFRGRRERSMLCDSLRRAGIH